MTKYKVFNFDMHEINKHTYKYKNSLELMDYYNFLIKEVVNVRIALGTVFDKVFEKELYLSYIAGGQRLNTKHITDGLINNSRNMHPVIQKSMNVLADSLGGALFADEEIDREELETLEGIILNHIVKWMNKVEEVKKVVQNEIDYLQKKIDLEKVLDATTKIKLNEMLEMNVYRGNTDLIRWNGSERQLIYLFDLLFNNDLLSANEYHGKRYALIAEHFKNKKGNKFDNKQLATTAIEMKDGKPNLKDAKIIEDIIDKSKEQD